MKKIVKLFVFLLVIFILTSCNLNDITHIHEIEMFYDSTGHWAGCECGEIYGIKENHRLTTTYDDNLEYETTYCSKCEYEITKKHEHVYNDDENVRSTCTSEGYLKNACKCGDFIIVETYEKIPHSFSELTVTLEPTLTEEGHGIGKCKCGEIEVTLPSLASEEYTTEVVSELTCTTNGSVNYHITINGYDLTIEVINESAGHSYEYAQVDPTCEEDGYTLVTCENCSYNNKTDYVDALGHKYSSSTIIAVPTLEETGAAQISCENCSHEESVTLPIINDTKYSFNVIEENDCENDGLVLYTFKEKSYISFEVKTFKTGHSYSSSVTQPSCTTEGYTTYICANCEDTYVDDYVDALGHQYTKWSVVLSPSLESEGLLERYCTIHPDVIQSSNLPILSETDYEVTTITEASCSIGGELSYLITFEDIEFTFNIATPVTDHPYDNTYIYDKTNHWNVSTCDHNVVKNLEEHIM